MYKSKIIFIILGLFFLAGCGYKQTVTQYRDVGYLKFIKSSTTGYKVVVNDKYQFLLDKCISNQTTGQCQDTTSDKLFEVSSGAIIVKVYDDNQKIIYEENLYLGSNNTKEITLP